MIKHLFLIIENEINILKLHLTCNGRREHLLLSWIFQCNWYYHHYYLRLLILYLSREDIDVSEKADVQT